MLLFDADEAAGAGQVLAHLLPALSEAARLVGAAPDAPTVLRTDPGLRRLVQVAPLGPLSEAEAEALLAAREVPEALRPALVGFARGHALALTLGADHARRAFAPDYNPAADVELAATLAARFADAVPTRAAREALYAATLVRRVDEPLLAYLLDTG